MLDIRLKAHGLSPRQVLPFGLLVPEDHRVNGKFAAWDPEFYHAHNIPLCKLDDVVMAKHAYKHGRSFRHFDKTLSYEWGVPTVLGRVNMLKRFTIGYLQMVKNLDLASLCPEFRFFEDQEYRNKILTDYMSRNNKLLSFLDFTVQMWDKAIEDGYHDFALDPLNPAFEAIEGSK